MKKETEIRAARTYDQSAGIELRAAEGESFMLVGHAAVFDTLSVPLWGFREKIDPGAFAKAITRDDVRALVEHDPARIIGRNKAKTLRLAEDEVGLKVEIDVPDTQVGRDLQVSVARGDLTQMSFSFSVVSESWKTKDKVDIRTLEELELFDVSVVAFPAYEDTDVAQRRLDAAKKAVEARLVIPVTFSFPYRQRHEEVEGA